MGWRPAVTNGIRERVTRGVFGVDGATLPADEADDDFAREPLVARRPRRPASVWGDAALDTVVTAHTADVPVLRLPPVRLGRNEATIALLLLAGVLGLLLNPSLPGAVLA